jgi:hypothetical protein
MFEFSLLCCLHIIFVSGAFYLSLNVSSAMRNIVVILTLEF